ncbi:hypothetical protein [Streptomyces peucetius]|uniref:Uncharacterized protein n=1 Tax=Streptomyces peucetius TaxID=1950 RepID=A0ABY6I6T5_STRPE|nr:hypothetical protein [Streptomyces peucetius]UYQ62705.1 hypothetical protein OGH68_15260 [Streptomyces peucetius]
MWHEKSRSLRWIASGLALLMSVTVMEGAAAASPRDLPVKADKPVRPTVTAAADIASAKVAARLSGKRVEALSERTETSTTWVNKDGSLTTELTAGPVRFRDGVSGDWRDVDLDLVASDGSVEPKAHPRGLRLSGKAGIPAASLKAAQAAKATDLVTLGEGDEQITLQWKGGCPHRSWRVRAPSTSTPSRVRMWWSRRPGRPYGRDGIRPFRQHRP